MKKRDDDANLSCSFCGKSQREVKKLIAGPTVYICDECIELCNDIIAEEYGQEEAAPASSRVPKPREIKASLDEYVIGQETARGLEGFLLRLVDRVKVKGKDTAVDCFEPLCAMNDATESLQARVAEYHRALDLYHRQSWDKAQALFEKLRANEPETLLYQIYLERIENLRDQDLPADWDGAYTHTSK